MAPHSSTLAWKIPWPEEPGRLQSMGSHRVRHDWSDLVAAAAGAKGGNLGCLPLGRCGADFQRGQACSSGLGSGQLESSYSVFSAVTTGFSPYPVSSLSIDSLHFTSHWASLNLRTTKTVGFQVCMKPTRTPEEPNTWIFEGVLVFVDL